MRQGSAEDPKLGHTTTCPAAVHAERKANSKKASARRVAVVQTTTIAVYHDTAGGSETTLLRRCLRGWSRPIPKQKSHYRSIGVKGADHMVLSLVWSARMALARTVPGKQALSSESPRSGRREKPPLPPLHRCVAAGKGQAQAKAAEERANQDGTCF